MNFNTVLAMIAASTPDGRWTMLQVWLKKNPKMRKRIDELSKQSPDEVIAELESWVIEKYGIGALALVNGDTRERIKSAIESLQARYNTRVVETQTEKEIKDVRTRRQVKGRSTKDHGRTNARAKRTDQA